MELRDARVLITGGSGFVGRHLAPRLAASGAHVTVLTRHPPRAAVVLPGIDLMADPQAAASRAPDVVINLAGAGIGDRPWSEGRRRLLRASRIDYTRALREAFTTRPPAVLVSASAIGYYGTSEHARFDETSERGAGFAASLCADWESEALAFEALGTRVVLGRIGLALGDGGLLQRLRLPFSLGLGARFGSGQQWMSWIHMADLLALFETAVIDEGWRGAYNFTAPEPVRNADFTAELAASLNRPAFIAAPGFLLRALLGEMAEELLLSGAAVYPQRARAAGFAFEFAEFASAVSNALGRRREAA
ncbi:MAG: TIGR01777 family oxidoreductase [Pseudomonadota bacterium]|nr:TIGR01777 family oxidoreductase [Pseudomonadota bacterium]